MKRKSILSSVLEGTILEAVSSRMKLSNLIELVFLRREGVYPFIVALWEADELKWYISIWEIVKLHKVSDLDFLEGTWSNGEKANLEVDQDANLLIPTKNGITLEICKRLMSRGCYCCWGGGYCLLFYHVGYVSIWCSSKTYNIQVLHSSQI